LVAVGLQLALITLINVHHILIVGYAIERIGGVLVGVATDLLTPELDLHGLGSVAYAGELLCCSGHYAVSYLSLKCSLTSLLYIVSPTISGRGG
jgi:hypothetical protein